MQAGTEEKPNPDHVVLSEKFNTLVLKLDKQEEEEEEENEAVGNHEDDYEDEEDEGDDFSFVCGGANTSPIAAEDIFVDGQIRPGFPLFDRDLLFSGGGFRHNLPVKKVFVETNDDNGRMTSSSSDRKAVEASPEICKKSNSTGFSKIWRFRDLLGRSNSDGKDAFVFLNNSHEPPSSLAEQPVSSVVRGDEKKGVNVKVRGKGKKGKPESLSAHEVYLKSKAKVDERRRSYLPYRPELMGFFTNVNGGLSKNVHPF